MVNAYVAELRKRDLTVGVVAVDPSSPFTGGAILGDRIRMADHVNDPDVFVRSVAARGHLGGLSLTTSRVIDVMDASGKDVVIVETVGTGQSELEIAQIADTKVVVCTPGFGDEIQAEKAGILEIADVFAVNKSDLPHADRTVTQLSRMLELARHKEWRIPIVKTTAVTSEGVAELATAIDAHAESGLAAKRGGPLARTRKLLATRAGALLERWIETTDDEEVDQICRAVTAGTLDFAHAAEKVTGCRTDRESNRVKPSAAETGGS